ncbi:MAG: type II toxin-antitoxin system RelE/ParE family toxin [Pseudomonadota bacterium]
MADKSHKVELTGSFLKRLDAIEAFLTEAGVPATFGDLLAELRGNVIPNLRRFPRLGRRYLDNPLQSAEALALLAQLPTGAADTLRVYLTGDYLILYTVTESAVYLLSIRHHRQLSFDFDRVWSDGQK